MSTIFYIVGAPASGKTTLVRSFLDMKSIVLIDKPKITICKSVCAAGHYSGGKFDGADTIPYNQDLKTANYMAKKNFFNASIVFLDGDRMSNKRVKKFLSDYQVNCIFIDISMETHLERARKRGSNQNMTWVKGRFTKSKRFYESFPKDRRIKLNGDSLCTEEMKSQILKFMEKQNGTTD